MSRKIIILMMVCLFSISISMNVSYFVNSQEKQSFVDIQFNLDSFLGFKTSQNIPDFDLSGYVNLSDNQILIDDRNPDFNWSKTAAENEWCSGSGTWNDPYVIENVLIDGEFNFTQIPTPSWARCYDTQSCINIYFSKSYFIIRNCFLTRSGFDEDQSGVYVRYSPNGRIDGNIIIYCHEGVNILESHNTTANYNIILHDLVRYGFSLGISQQGAENCTISQNLIMNTNVGIQTFDIKGTLITQNLLNSTLRDAPIDTAIFLMFSNETRVTRNVLAGDFAGIKEFYIDQEGVTHSNVVVNNTIQGTLPSINVPSLKSSGSYNTFMLLDSSSNNYIAHNVLYFPGYITESIIGYDLFTVLISLSLSICFLSIIILTSKKRFAEIEK